MGGMARELHLEVLHVEGLLAYRKLRGHTRPLKPAVEVTFQAQVLRSPAVSARRNAAAFSWKAFFGIGKGDPCICFRVYDQTPGALICDQLIGDAVLPLLEVCPSDGLLFTCSLRKHGQTTGQIAVHYQLATTRGPLCPNLLVSNAFGETVCTNTLLDGYHEAGEASPCTAKSSELHLGGLAASRNSCRSSSSDRSNCGSDDGFESALEEVGATSPTSQGTSPTAAQQRQICERIANSYIQARMQNDLGSLQKILSRDAVVAVPRPLGGSTQHRGWNEIEAYFKNNPAAPDSFREWTHASTEDEIDAEGISKATAVRWVGKLYKYGLWHQVQCDFLVDSMYLIRRVSIVNGR